MVTVLIMISFFLAVLAFELFIKISRYRYKIERGDIALRHEIIEKNRANSALQLMRETLQQYSWLCRHGYGNNGKWRINDLGNGFEVVKYNQDDSINIIARTYFYATDDEDEKAYAKNNAEELLEKLTEEV